MKKIFTLSLLAIASVGFAQNVVITKVVDGTLASDGCSGVTGTSNPKIVELYVSGTVDLTNVRLQTESNGAADAAAISWSNGTDLTSLGKVTNSFIYLVGAGETTFKEMYPSLIPATGLTSLPNGNGNDALRLVLTDGAVAPATFTVLSVIDQFGNPLQIVDSADFSAAWAYQDSYASRNSGVGPNAGNFETSSFTYGGNDKFDAPNNTCDFLKTDIALGSYSLSVNDNQIDGLNVYPNPVSNGVLYISSVANLEKEVVVFDIQGKEVLRNVVTENVLNVSSLKTGNYLVKITEAGKVSTKKLVIE